MEQSRPLQSTKLLIQLGQREKMWKLLPTSSVVPEACPGPPLAAHTAVGGQRETSVTHLTLQELAIEPTVPLSGLFHLGDQDQTHAFCTNMVNLPLLALVSTATSI